jgi:predicted dehydrogenase
MKGIRLSLSVGIVGAGLIGLKRAREIVQNPSSRLVAVADQDITRAQALAEQFGGDALGSWQDLLERADIDAVVVATTHNSLAPITEAALQAGKHVLCEKPLAMSVEQAEGLVQAAAKNGTKLKTGFNHRHHPALWQAHCVFKEGQIGRLMFLRCRYGHGGRLGYEKEWRANPTVSGGGQLIDQAIHVLDLFRWFAGEFDDIYAILPTTFWNMPVEDNVFCTMRVRGGAVATLHASWTQWKNLFSFEVFGTDGYLIVDGLGGSYGAERLVIGRRPQQFGVPTEQVSEFPGVDVSWAQEWQEFISAIQENRTSLADGQDGLEALRLVEAAYQSSRLGTVIKLRGLSGAEGHGGGK